MLYIIGTLEWQACEIMAELVEGLQTVLSLGHHRNGAFPAFLTPTLRNIIVSLSRLPLVNSHTRVPPLVSLLTTCLEFVYSCIVIEDFCVGLETRLVPSARRRVWNQLA